MQLLKGTEYDLLIETVAKALRKPRVVVDEKVCREIFSIKNRRRVLSTEQCGWRTGNEGALLITAAS